MEQNRIFGLDLMRAAAIIMVLCSHVLWIYPTTTGSVISLIHWFGYLGVELFFVLSGFLISYILIFEKKANKTINLKNFLAKRILKIWPLFYAMLLFAFLTPFILKLFQLSFSNEGYEPNWLLSVLFLENYNIMLTNNSPNVSPLRVMWSLCIEEHFYIIWGFLFSIIPLNKIKYLIIISIVLASVCRVFYSYFDLPFLDLFTNIDYFAFGAIPAYVLSFKKEQLILIEKLSYSFKIIICLLTIIAIFGFSNLNFEWLKFVKPIMYGILFATILSFVITEQNSLKIKDTLWISKLGIYTYGLYLYHTIIINLFIKLNRTLELNWVLISIISFMLTVFVSVLSYHIFEKQFLKLKTHFN